MYCPTELHDKTSAHSDLDQLKAAWQSIYQKTKHIGLPYKVSFSGGEVTANRSFLPMIRYLRNGEFDMAQILVSTNGSASLNYYKKLAEVVDAISFSVHGEFIQEKIFFDKILQINQLMVRPKKSLHVDIMDEFWNQDRIGLYRSWCKVHDISHSVNRIDYQHVIQNKTYPILKGAYDLDTI